MEITEVELKNKIENGEKLLVDFYGTWCMPCKRLKPIYEKVSQENDSEVGMYMMDVDLNKDFAMSLGIRSVPTIKVFNKGEVVDTKVGLLSEETIKGLITTVLHG